MNKKGVIWEDLADIFLAGLILLAAFMIFILTTGIHEERIEDFFQQKIANLDTDEIFVSYLNAQVNGYTVTDHVTQSYYDSNKDLESVLDNFLEQVYSSKVCWILSKDEKEWIKKNKCKKEENLLESQVIIPLPNNKIVEAKLLVNGYVT